MYNMMKGNRNTHNNTNKNLAQNVMWS